MALMGIDFQSSILPQKKTFYSKYIGAIFLGKIEDWNSSYYSDFKTLFGKVLITNTNANVHKINFQSIYIEENS